jgi:hypothetical protein
MTTPYTLDDALTRWGVGAPSDATLTQLLAVSWTQCTAYAPVADEEDIPVGHREAHYQQARNIWNASKVGPAGSTGPDDFMLTPHPLDWHVKQLLRPRRAVPVMR